MQEKTEKPTAKKLKDARNRGEVAKSPLLIHTASLGVLMLFLVLVGSSAIDWTFDMFQRIITAASKRDSGELLWSTSAWMVSGAIWAMATLLVAAALGAAIGAFAQVQALFSIEPLSPKFDRMNPGTNLKNVFSSKQLFELLKTILHVLVMGAAFYLAIREVLPNLLRAQSTDIGTLMSMSVKLLLWLLMIAFLVSLVLSAVDYGIQRFEFIKKQRMSIQDVRYEHKDVEGDPYIRAQRKRLHLSLSRGPLRQQVERASVVVVNPTHIAVALRFTHGEDELPRVIVKGEDQLAAEIRRFAEAGSIPVVRSPRLARALYQQIDDDEYISEEFFDAVAAVLTAVGAVRTSPT